MYPWSDSFKINISNDRERYREECRRNFMTNNQLQMSRSLPWNRWHSLTFAPDRFLGYKLHIHHMRSVINHVM